MENKIPNKKINIFKDRKKNSKLKLYIKLNQNQIIKLKEMKNNEEIKIINLKRNKNYY